MTSDRVSDERLADFTTPSSQTRGPTMQECIDMARELQHLRSPVTVSDEMVERFGKSFWGTYWVGDHQDKAQVRKSLTAALSKPVQEMQELPTLIDWANRFHDGPLMASDHDFDSESAQGKWCYEVAEFFWNLSLSSLEAVERERDAWKDTAEAVGRYSADERSRAETAEASLAAAREETERLKGSVRERADVGIRLVKKVKLAEAVSTAAAAFVPAYEEWMDKHKDDVALSFYRPATFGDLRAYYSALAGSNPK